MDFGEDKTHSRSSGNIFLDFRKVLLSPLKFESAFLMNFYHLMVNFYLRVGNWFNIWQERGCDETRIVILWPI